MSPVHFFQRIIRGPAASPSHVAETSAAGAGGPASEDRFIPSSVRPSGSSASTSTPGERAVVDPSRLSMRQLKKLPEIQAWLASSPRSERASRRLALQRILDCATNGGRLDLVGLGLTVLPECIGDIQDLKELCAQQNSLRSLPVSLGRLQSLEDLSLGNNSLRDLPESLGRLERLKTLWVYGNSLESLPANIGQLKSLWHINIMSNSLRSLPASIGDLQNLRHLNVMCNSLEDLPESIGGLQNLDQLYVSGNSLRGLPDSLGLLRSLGYLGVSKNLLRRLPDSIGQLQCLKILNANDNSLECLPESFGQLQSLEELSILRNPELRSLPRSIELLRNLRVWEIAPLTMPESFMRRQLDRVVERPAIEPPSSEDAWISEFISEHMPSAR